MNWSTVYATMLHVQHRHRELEREAEIVRQLKAAKTDQIDEQPALVQPRLQFTHSPALMCPKALPPRG